jgi:hypothetical protein
LPQPGHLRTARLLHRCHCQADQSECPASAPNIEVRANKCFGTAAFDADRWRPQVD